MKRAILILGAFLLASSVKAAALKTGDSVPNLCWQNDQTEEICLEDYSGKTRVLIYNAMF